MANEQQSAARNPDTAITPADIQSQEFAVTRFGGYRMRDVDEFLDRLTGSTEALLTENERLRAGGGPIVGTSDLDEVNRQADEIVQRARDEAARITAEARERAASMAGSSAAGAAAAVDSADERAAVDAFLTQERDFLQSLATLVQGHAESVKGMARKARNRPAAAPAADAEAESAEEPPPDAPTRDESTSDESTAGTDPAQTQAMPRTTDEPIRVDDAEPAVASGSEHERDGDPSLRQLFWGEEG